MTGPTGLISHARNGDGRQICAFLIGLLACLIVRPGVGAFYD